MEEIKEQNSETRLMPGIMVMIQQAKGIINSQEKEIRENYTYKDQMHAIARNMVAWFELTGKYKNSIPRSISEKTPFYSYEITDVEGFGPDAICRIIAKGKAGTPAEGESWSLLVDASEDTREIQSYVKFDE